MATFIVAAVVGLAGWFWSLHADRVKQKFHLTKHDNEIVRLPRGGDRILATLGETLRELRGQK